MGALAFGLCYYVIDACGQRRFTTPLVAYGRNAILVFVASGLLAKTLGVIHVPGPDGTSPSLQSVLHHALFTPLLPPYPASVAWALANVAAWCVALLALHRRGLYFKV
jgi:predicted acyltransferase